LAEASAERNGRGDSREHRPKRRPTEMPVGSELDS
jgi:hypothetical protein